MIEIRANFVIEILGRPAAHIKEALNMLIERLSKERNISVVNKKIHEPREVENNFFTTFAEVELKAYSYGRILDLIFSYMPSSIEIFSPPELKMELSEANAIANALTTRLHMYDAIAKKITMEKEILHKQLLQRGMKPAIGEEVKQGKGKTKKSKRKK